MKTKLSGGGNRQRAATTKNEEQGTKNPNKTMTGDDQDKEKRSGGADETQEAKPDDRREEVAAAVSACIGQLWQNGGFKASELIDGTAIALGELVLVVAMNTGSHLKRLVLATCAVVDMVAHPSREPMMEKPASLILMPGRDGR